MKIIKSEGLDFIPASHENSQVPGVLKKFLFRREDLQAGQAHFVNWARLPPGRSFVPHYHEDMQEIFVLVQGEAEITVNGQRALLRRGDAISIAPREIHEMFNRSTRDVEFIVIGITANESGRTVVVPQQSAVSGR